MNLVIAGKPYRVGIVGASSLAGKELSDALTESPLAASDVVLLDAEDTAGRVTTAADEISFIQKIDADSFAGLDLVFFAGDRETTRNYWKSARAAGASIIDMTQALDGEEGVVLRGSWAALVGERRKSERTRDPDLTTRAVTSAHPGALILLLLASRLQAKFVEAKMAVTMFEPASEYGKAAMDELHQQTVSLLSFQSLPREQYDAQVAFNLLPWLGSSAKVSLAETRGRIVDQYAALSAVAAPELTLQLIQAPVFHGYTASVLIELAEPATIADVEAALQGKHVDLIAEGSDAPSNLSAAGQAEVLISVTQAEGDGAPRRFWIWFAADNLKLAAVNAIACATELARLRPQGSVQ